MVGAIEEKALEEYFSGRLGRCRVLGVKALGKGAHGTGYEVRVRTKKGDHSYVLKSVSPEGLGHDYPSDRAGMFLLALDTFSGLPNHVQAIDVLALMPDGGLRSIGGGREYFLLMEQAEGASYFKDLAAMGRKKALGKTDRERIASMAEYLNRIHSVKKDSRVLYLRKLRDIIGHGECLMGVFDSYPEGVLSPCEMTDIEKKCIEWRAILKPEHRRLSMIHGDFHPGNIWWKGRATGLQAMRLLDRSRGPWGEPADDVTALTINYVFFSIRRFRKLRGAYLEALALFFEEYIKRTGDQGVLRVLAPFYAFRGAVVANPVFYPDVGEAERRLVFRFIHNVLDAGRFEPGRAEKYVNTRSGSPF